MFTNLIPSSGERFKIIVYMHVVFKLIIFLKHYGLSEKVANLFPQHQNLPYSRRMKYFMTLFIPPMKNCPGVSPVAAHLNTTTIPTRTPASSGRNETLTIPVLGQGLYRSQIFLIVIYLKTSHTPLDFFLSLVQLYHYSTWMSWAYNTVTLLCLNLFLKFRNYIRKKVPMHIKRLSPFWYWINFDKC